ncbi:MAG: sigma 54-interacting transcriptional regulator [Melioribacter sp.]|nr:sigma 54-interacting transcriptional regulator [Melioribacter sp.]
MLNLRKFQIVYLTSNFLQNKNLIRTLAIIVGLIIVIVLKPLAYEVNYNIENFFRIIGGEKKPDSSIIIIHIDSNDIEKLGGWPLRRSYYALLINKLSQYKVKRIGLEVFLSSNIAFQTIYNDLLKEELIKSKRVVLSSIVTNKNKLGESYEHDTLLYSQPKNDLIELESGHLNYIVKDGIYIPTVIYVNNKQENAFSIKLAGEKFFNKRDLLKINFYTSWEKFNKYSLIEFFRESENDSSFSKKFFNKIVIVGVSESSIAKTISTFYDDELPGVGLHAFALDNILTNRYLKYQSSVFISVLFLLMLIISSQIKIGISNIKLMCIICFVYVAFSFILFINYSTENNYSVVLIPAFLIYLSEGIIYLMKNKIMLNETSKEVNALKVALTNKEQLLLQLLKEKNKNEELIKKIEILKDEIQQLKKYKDDETINYNKEEIKVFEGMVYKSEEMHKIVELIKKISPTDVNVLILGESGSGKELVARAIHNLSKRKDKKFVAVNCAALPETLLESELFGYVKGAFTNAYSDKKGRFEIANGGTIFLDEIAETSENFQAKLLRVIQFGDFEKVGSSETIHTDVRVIAATNKNLDELVRQKKFREDLFYRLNVIRIEIPPLRKRKSDIEALVNYFLQKEDNSIYISKAVMENLLRYEWKGNVRELESLIKRMIIFAKSENRTVITLRDLPEEYHSIDKEDFEKVLLNMLREKKFSHSSINQIAQELNLSRTIVSENFRGIFFKTFVNSKFNMTQTVKEISQTDESEVLKKVTSKVKIYLENIRKDLLKANSMDFDMVKEKFSSKYKNLPVRYHQYLDEVIKYFLFNKND